MISNREFLTFFDGFESDKEKGTWYVISTSVDGPVHTSGCVRAENNFSIQRWKAIDGGKSELTIYTQVAMGGWLPQYVIDRSVMGAPVNMLIMNDLMK
jgi:hypothetical protein